MQSEIAEIFKLEKIEFKKEVVLTNGIIDFMIGNIGLEVKIKGQPIAIYRQLERYLQDKTVNKIINQNRKTTSFKGWI